MMDDKLGIGSQFPRMTINLVRGGTMDLPGGRDQRYNVVLFYRGPWCPYCRRQLRGFEAAKPELDALGVSIFAASVDALDKAREVQDEVTYPIGYGVTRAMGDLMGSWWDDGRGFIQPSEFLLDRSGKVVFSSYSDGPLGRYVASEMVGAIRHLDKKAAQNLTVPA